MIKRLHLLRHAKSSWDDAALADHERPLNRRGIDACALVAADLRDGGVGAGVDLVLCSTAVRTRETLELIESSLPDAAEIRFERRIYESGARELAELIAGNAGAAESVLAIGHNPAIGALASALAGDGPADRLELMRAKFPTAARASLVFDGEWSELGRPPAVLEAFVRPRDLAG